jgi:hypothetical protein
LSIGQQPMGNDIACMISWLDLPHTLVYQEIVISDLYYTLNKFFDIIFSNVLKCMYKQGNGRPCISVKVLRVSILSLFLHFFY